MTLTAPSRARTEALPLFVVGSRGMLAGELLRLAHGHPALRLAGAVSREPGVALGRLHPHLEGETTIDLDQATGELVALARGASDPEELRAVVVLGLPHGTAARSWRGLREALGEAARHVGVVDLSADYRLRDPEVYARWYGAPHADPEELPRFRYGLPELTGESLVGARRIAAPGCFATALQLASVPAAAAGWLDETSPWRYSAVTGSSGSGIEPKVGTHHPFRHGNLWAYGLGGHRHEAELGQALAAQGVEPEVCFLPHSGPFARGIHLTAMLPLKRDLDAAEARATYARAYAGHAFVRVEAEGVPDLRRVVGSNSAALGVAVRGRTLVVLATIDNLIKGGAGQALQCVNLMLGLPEDQNLPRLGLGVA